MLDFIYYPVAWILWVWHKVFGFVFQDPSNGFAWALSVVFLVFTLRGAARKAGQALDNAQQEMQRQRASAAPVSGTSVVNERDSLLDEKLDHSFKIIEVQKRVIADERAKGPSADEDMINRALETIEITASNARDMIRPDRRGSSSSETVSGTVL